jgi:preprotein translocase subunit SecD
MHRVIMLACTVMVHGASSTTAHAMTQEAFDRSHGSFGPRPEALASGPASFVGPARHVAPARPEPIRLAQATGWWDLFRRLFGRSTSPAEAAAALERDGGWRVRLRIDAEALRGQMLGDLRDETRRVLRDARIGFSDLAVRDGGIEVSIREGQDLQPVMVRAGQISGPSGEGTAAPAEVRDMGDRMIRLTPPEAAVKERQQHPVKLAVTIIERRIAELEMVGAAVEQDGADGVLLLLPGVADPSRAIAIATRRGQLAFRLVERPASSGETGLDRAPADAEVLASYQNRPYVVQRKVAMTGDDLIDAGVVADQQTGEPAISFRFNSAGTLRFGELTQANVGRAFAIVLDGKILAAPVIREPIVGGSAQISGGFTAEDARDIAVLLRAGALPAPLAVAEQQAVKPGSRTGRR